MHFESLVQSVKAIMITRNLAVVSICLSVTACASKYVTEPPTVADRPPLLSGDPQPPIEPALNTPGRSSIEPATLPPRIPAPTLPAAVNLRDQAANASAAGDHTRAVGLLERALRISPEDAQTYHDLASNHLAMNQPQQALQLARRGLTLNPTNPQRSALEQLVSRSQASL